MTSSKHSSPLIVVGQTICPTVPTAFPALNDDVCVVTHSATAKDQETGYNAPGAIEFKWAGSAEKGRVSADVKVDKLGSTVGEGGLIEKVDVLAEIPYVLRKTLAAVTGTKPYIYQVSLGVLGSRTFQFDGVGYWLMLLVLKPCYARC